MRAIIGFKLALLAFGLLFFQPLFSDSMEDLDKYIEKARTQNKVPGVAVVVVKEDKIVFVKGYGVCHIDKPEKVNADTIFQLASVSKTFASAGLGVQVDQKKLSWDDEVIKHLPQFALKDAYPSRYASARDLLAHRTGLPAFRGDLLSKVGYTPQEVLYRVRFIEPQSSFREKALYSNVGYFISGQLLEKLANNPWEKVIQSTLLDPLKMTRSGFAANLDKTNVATSHAIIEGSTQVIPYDKSVMFVAAGGVTSTAHDMGNWMIMHLNGGAFEGKQVLTSETVKEMHAPSMVAEVTFTELPPINEWASFSFGLGWDSYNYKGRYIVEKAGALDGIRSVVTMIPELKAGITILANLNLTVLPELIRAKYLEMQLGKSDEDMEKEINEKGKKIAGMLALPEKPKDALPFSRQLDQCAGTYSNDLYGDFVVEKAGDKLVLKVGPGPLEASLTHWSNDTFLLGWPSINMGHEDVTFTFGEDGKAKELQTETFGNFKRKEKAAK